MDSGGYKLWGRILLCPFLAETFGDNTSARLLGFLYGFGELQKVIVLKHLKGALAHSLSVSFSCIYCLLHLVIYYCYYLKLAGTTVWFRKSCNCDIGLNLFLQWNGLWEGYLSVTMYLIFLNFVLYLSQYVYLRSYLYYIS